MSLTVNHPVIHRVEADIFRITFAADCIQHQCRCREEGDRRRNDACCQYGADVLLPEKQAILRRAREVASILKPERRDTEHWFDERDPEEDPEAPGGILLRTATSDGNDETSGLHLPRAHRRARLRPASRRAAQRLRPRRDQAARVPPLPLSWSSRWLGLSPEFHDYSCAQDGGPTVYRLMRQVLGEVFDQPLVQELDRLESKVIRRRLPIRMSLAR